MRTRLFLGLGSIGMILLLSSVISILEYRRMSNYVSDLIASDINCINISQKLALMADEYNLQMLSVVVENDMRMMPDFDHTAFEGLCDSLRNSLVSEKARQVADSVLVTYNTYIRESYGFEDVFLSDTIDTGSWFFGSLQPRYSDFRHSMEELNNAIHEELKFDSANFDDGFYRSIMPGVVSVGAGLLLVVLLLYFIMSYYVRPICRIADGIDNYRAFGRRHTYTFDGDDQIAEINTGVSELIEENIELKRRVKALREDREKLLSSIDANS